jgi:hypothetical protein
MFEAVMDRRQRGVSRHKIHNIEICSLLPVVLLGHLTCFASRVKAAYNGSFGGRGNKARLSISSLRSEAAGVTSLGVNQSSFRNQQVENSPGLRNAL